MSDKNETQVDIEEMELSFLTLFDSIESHINSLKKNSSEEILNGSVSRAQEIIGKILPYESFYAKKNQPPYRRRRSICCS